MQTVKFGLILINLYKGVISTWCSITHIYGVILNICVIFYNRQLYSSRTIMNGKIADKGNNYMITINFLKALAFNLNSLFIEIYLQN